MNDNKKENETHAFFFPPFFPFEILLFFLQFQQQPTQSETLIIQSNTYEWERGEREVPDCHGCGLERGAERVRELKWKP